MMYGLHMPQLVVHPVALARACMHAPVRAVSSLSREKVMLWQMQRSTAMANVGTQSVANPIQQTCRIGFLRFEAA